MSTLNVGAMAARLGLDPSDFLDKMKGVEGFASGSGQRIAAEMKRTSREGAESLRLIDEALGVHLSRPVTRIISQEFPALASGLSSILGAGVFGAITFAGVEAFDKLSEKMEKAQKAQEAYRESLDKLKTSFDEVMAGYAKSTAERGLTGIDKKLFEVDTRSLEEARRQLDELSKDAQDSAKKGEDAGGLWTRTFATIGEAAHLLFSSASTLGVEQANKQFEEFRKQIDAIAIANQADPTRGLTEELKAVQSEAAKAAESLASMTALRLSSAQEAISGLNRLGGGVGLIGFSDKEIAAQQVYLDNLKKILDVLKANAADNAAGRGSALGEDYEARTAKQQAAMETMLRDVQASYAKLAPIANPFVKIEADLDGMRTKADNDFAALAASGANALELRLARQRLDDFMGYWRQKMSEARQDAQIWAAQQMLPNNIPSTATMPAFAMPTPAMPSLSLAPVRTDLQELAKVQTDANAAWQKAGEVLESLETPLEKYQTGLAILNTLHQQVDEKTGASRLSDEQYTAAVQKLNVEFEKEEDHLRKLQKELLKYQENSTSAAAGAKAFVAQTQITGLENGKAAFDLLNQGLNSFEDDTIKILEHGKVSWRKYFEDLAAMALKFMETKTMGTIFSAFTHQHGPTQMPQISATGAISSFDQRMTQQELPLPQPLSPAGALASSGSALGGATTGTASMTSAGTTLTTAGTTLSTAGATLSSAAAALSAAAATMSTSGAITGAGASATGDISSFAGFFAGGGDVTPGQDFIAGEAGPELIHAGSAGASITPNSKIGGQTVYNDFRGTVMTDDLMRRAEGMQAIQSSERRMMTAIPTLQREINLRQRSNR